MTETAPSAVVATDLAELRRMLPALRAATLDRASAPTLSGLVSGGAPSWELIRVDIHDLLTEVRRDVDVVGSELCRELGHNWHKEWVLDDALARLATAWEGHALAIGPTPVAAWAAETVARWLQRARYALGELKAPYPLVWPDGSQAVCPVVDEVACGGRLFVVRDELTTVPSWIRCRAAPRTHRWRSGPEWLRLGALLGA